MNANNPDPVCNNCRGFYITHDPDWPYGCRLIGIRSQILPARQVRLISQAPCMAFVAKNETRKQRRATPPQD